MWPAERTINFHQNMTFDPIKDGFFGGSITQNYRCVDLTMNFYDAHRSVKNLKEIRQEMWPAERTHFHQNMIFDPIKDGTLGEASPKTIGV